MLLVEMQRNELNLGSVRSSTHRHPGRIRVYQLKVEQLDVTLNNQPVKAHAADVLRKLFDRAERFPRAEGSDSDAQLQHGRASITSLCQGRAAKQSFRNGSSEGSTAGGH